MTALATTDGSNGSKRPLAAADAIGIRVDANETAPRTKDFLRTTYSGSDRVVLRALGEAMFSEEGDVSPERLDALVDEIDAYVSPASRGLRVSLVLMLKLIRYAPILLFFAGTTFDALSVQRRVKLLEKMDVSRIALLSLVVVAYRTIMTMVFYERPEEQKLLGYPGAERKTHLRLTALS